MKEKISVIGLGYVGLPVALAFARKFPDTVGFDTNCGRVEELRKGHDRNNETTSGVLLESSLRFSCEPEDLASTTMFVVAVPTPVDENNVPDLTPLVKASEFVGKHIKPGAIVCYESTVYPGATEEVCGPILEKVSGLQRGVDFKLAYSPERINPGDTVHTLETVVKVVAGEDMETLERVAGAYGGIVPAGVHKATSIKVAEAAKVIENTQRDLNIALMNELAVIFDRLGIRTLDVLEAAGTKWNFLPFRPGLVGGHCIGVDPYYLTAKAQQVGYQPEVILAGRRINNNVAPFLATKMTKLLIENDIPVKRARVGILGLTFKEDVNDLRNSKVPEIMKELCSFGIDAVIHDPHADSREAMHEYGIKLTKWEDIRNLDGLIIAVGHKAYKDMGQEKLLSLVRHGGVVIDAKSILKPATIDRAIRYWSL
ncbi:MAG: UDP-N-acetyl-D-galactosamine dehydrogenase [Myxococcales bacterium 68-20]|nr:nucleotide sugar dehydrogenase [Myxococcales bacterium]OJY28530.1 MAG: UDP-N-acetyl-D-galactosamine dehydrogenase [Myxococcales bacterium 68-20]